MMNKIIYELNQKILASSSFIEMLSVRFFLESIFSAPSVTSKKKQMEFFYFSNGASLKNVLQKGVTVW